VPNTSATGGLLSPNVSPAPLQDAALLDFFHDWICSITGLGSDLVRPRWQAEPPNIPLDGVTWLAFGITKRVADTFAAELHYPAGLGYNEIRRHEELSFLISCYGNSADTILHLFRDGVQVSQNREVLQLNNMGLIETGDIQTVPEMVKEKWMYRADMTFSIRRQIVRDYQVQNVLGGPISINNEHYVTTVNP